MPVYKLPDNDLWFPEPHQFDEDQDIVAVGGDLSPDRVLAAYREGIFPWFNEGDPVMWWHPRKRMVLRPGEVKVSKSSRNLLNRGHFKITYNTSFAEVVENCQNIERQGQGGSWISDEIKHSAVELHKRGFGYSAECWQDDELVGGLYGIMMGRVFMGDSMFSKVSNASKITFIHFCRRLAECGFALIDCQLYNNYLASLGAYEIDRDEYIEILQKNWDKPPKVGCLDNFYI